jgi:internalin A
MADIFISYTHEDLVAARALAHGLAYFGWSVFDDRRIPLGRSFMEVLERELTASRCVIVLWTGKSTGSAWVLDEAQWAHESGKPVFHVFLEGVRLPLQFRRYQAVDLSGWDGDTDAGEFQVLAEAIADRIGAVSAQPLRSSRVEPERRPLNEGKLILVGFGGVGKTTLVNRLILGRPFNKHESKTDGIRISDWTIRIANTPARPWETDLPDEPPPSARGLLARLRATVAKPERPLPADLVRMHVWDFGGQEIMHATHQFFLTSRSLYLLVLNGRQGREDADAEYWLSMIAAFGSDSPVVVVLNKVRQQPFDVNRRALQLKFPNVRAFVETDCEDDTGVRALTRMVYEEIDRMPHLRDTFPASWFSVKDLLTNMTENYLSFDHYRHLCERVGESDANAQETLASFLHTLGVALNYRDDPRLRDLHVLKPEWVTEGIYSILNNKSLTIGHGELTLAQMGSFLDPKRYPPERHLFLLELMRKFELCIRFPEDDDRYLIPELLDKQEPATAEPIGSEGLAFEYHYPTLLPEGLLPRFIVRTSALSGGQPRWRTGVVLTFDANYAVVKADPIARTVRIHVTGPVAGRRRLLAVIRSDFEHIHRTYAFRPKEMVPIEGHPGLIVPYDKLLVLERNGVTTMQEVYGDDVVSLSVSALLDGVDLDGVRAKGPRTDRLRKAVNAFISFAHEDDALRAELETHLKLLRRLSLLDTWTDRRIAPGADWKGQIDEALERADLIMLLVSADFVGSDYCWDVEMERALVRAAEGSATLIPIIVRTCMWKDAPFGKLQVLPDGGKPVTAGGSKAGRDKAWTKVADGIADLLKETHEH